MARPSNEVILRRRTVVKKMITNNPTVSENEIIKELRKQGINTTLPTVKEDMIVVKMEDDEENNVVDNGLKELYITMQKVDKEIAYNEAERDKCKSESAKSQFSRLVSNLVQDKAKLAATIADIKLNARQKVVKQYTIRIGDFPVVEEANKDE